MTKEPIEIVHLLANPSRYRICRLLQRKDAPMYISQIAKELDMDRKLLSHHLATLSQYGLVTGEFDKMNPPKGAPKLVKYYTLTEKTKGILEQISNIAE